MLYELIGKSLSISPNWKNLIFINLLIFSTSFATCFVAMKYFLKLINRYNICRQPIRSDGPQTHLKEKKNTPTMGGLIIVLSTVFTAILWVDITHYYIFLTLFVLLSFSSIGFVDDFIKVRGSNTKGFRGSIKIILQFAIIGAVLLILQLNDSLYLNNQIDIPFSDLSINIGYAYATFATCVVVGCANSVNLTDGLDGLLTVPAIIALYVLAFIAYYGFEFGSFNAEILNVVFLCCALMGALLAFLKYNYKPAKIFMGDVGSLGIGATLGIIAIILKIELVFFIIALLFVIEAMSVILQVASYKIRKKRIFLMSPIHHHFEKLGWKELKVVKVFWLASLIFAVMGLIGFLYNI